MTASIVTKGSICTGTGALDRATPGYLKWVAEIDPDASRLLKREHPDAPNLEDITAEDFRAPRVDLLTSGDPCQSMSGLGHRRSARDARFLWTYVMSAIEQARPTHIFLENVRELISRPLLPGADDWRGQKGSVLRLRLDALLLAGYSVKWGIIGACAIGAPHHRHRWFLRAKYAGTMARPAERVHIPCGAPRTSGRMLLPTPRASDLGTAGRRSSENWRPQLGQVVLRLDDRLDPYADSLTRWEQAIGRPAPAPTIPHGQSKRLNPALSEWMMGYPEGFLTEGNSLQAAYRLAGNGVVKLQAEYAWRTLRL